MGFSKNNLKTQKKSKPGTFYTTMALNTTDMYSDSGDF